MTGEPSPMQTRCPKCTTIVKAKGTDWAIINGACLELSGTEGKTNRSFARRFRTSFSLKSYCPVLRMLVTGGPPIFGGGATPQRDNRSRIVWKHAGHRRQVADVAVDDAEQRDDRGLAGGDAVEIAHSRVSHYAK
jgi:hypothetical protein